MSEIGRGYKGGSVCFSKPAKRLRPSRPPLPRGEREFHAISIAIAVASPPPMQSDATPRLMPTRPERREQRHQNARARGADRMAERAGAAVDVDLFVRKAEVAHRRHGDDGEGLVDLEEIDGILAPAGLLEQLLDRADRRGREILRRGGVRRMRDDPGERRQRRASRPRSRASGRAPRRRRRSSSNWPPSPCRLRGRRA